MKGLLGDVKFSNLWQWCLFHENWICYHVSLAFIIPHLCI